MTSSDRKLILKLEWKENKIMQILEMEILNLNPILGSSQLHEILRLSDDVEHEKLDL